jgi:hypothetical protein
MEPESSLPHSQVHTNYVYPEPAQSNPYLQTPHPEDPPSYYPLINAWVSPVVLFPQAFPTNPKFNYANLIRKY